MFNRITRQYIAYSFLCVKCFILKCPFVIPVKVMMYFAILPLLITDSILMRNISNIINNWQHHQRTFVPQEMKFVSNDSLFNNRLGFHAKNGTFTLACYTDLTFVS